MPYLILILGLLIGLYALYRFFISASIAQVKAMFFTALLCVIGVAVLVLSLTGRLPAAFAILATIVPVIMSIRRSIRAQDNPNGDIILKDEDVEVLSSEEDDSGSDSDKEA